MLHSGGFEVHTETTESAGEREPDQFSARDVSRGQEKVNDSPALPPRVDAVLAGVRTEC